MFATGEPLCPVLSFEKYVSHLNPNNEFFFQRPKRVVNKSDGVCYDNVVGQRTLDEKMKKLSTDDKLFYNYTNHSIRATTITVLDECGYEARQTYVQFVCAGAILITCNSKWRFSDEMGRFLMYLAITMW